MSLHESLLIGLFLILVMTIFWKWTKAMLLIVTLEMASALILTGIFSGGILSFLILTVLLFFVCEALIILSSLFSQMRSLGMTYSIVSLW